MHPNAAFYIFARLNAARGIIFIEGFLSFGNSFHVEPNVLFILHPSHYIRESVYLGERMESWKKKKEEDGEKKVKTK